MNMSFSIASLLVAAFFSLSSCKSSKSDKENMPFETVIQSQFLGSEKPANLYIQSLAELKKTFVVSNNNDMPEELLEVDYQNKAVIIVSAGMKNTGGFGIEIKEIVEEKNQVVVMYEETSPSKKDMVAMALTYPMHAVSIPKTNKEVIFMIPTK